MMNLLNRLTRYITLRLRNQKMAGPSTYRIIDPARLELDLLVAAADAFRDARNPGDAAPLYRQAVTLAPQRHDLIVQLGNMLKDSGALVEAVMAYQQALQSSEQADTYLQLGHVLKALGDRENACCAYQRALMLDPETAGAVQELAAAGRRQEQARRFEANLRGGGVEALLALSRSIAEMKAELDRLSLMLPEALSRTAFPIASYDSYRVAFPVPNPPSVPSKSLKIVLLADPASLDTLFRQVAAIQAQSSACWSLSVIGSRPDLRRIVELAGVADARVKWVEVSAGADTALAERAECSDTDWLLLLAEGAVLDQHAVSWFSQAIDWGGADAYFCDEEMGEVRYGRITRSRPVLRAVIDYDSLLEANVAGETIAVASAALHALQVEINDVSDPLGRAALLRSLANAYRVGHIPYPLIWRPASKQMQAGVLDGIRITGPIPVSSVQAEQAEICVIIPTRDNAFDLAALIESLRRTAADTQGLVFTIMDNGTVQADHVALLHDLSQQSGIRVIRRDGAFNWSYLNNEAAAVAHSPLLLFANDDMQMVTTAWDSRLRTLLGRDDVGAVGARLLYENDTIQHGGILFGWNGSVIHDGLHEPAESMSANGRWHTTRAVGAVTGAFLATRRTLFSEVGGFDAIGLPVGYSDIDFALKVRSAGLKIIWTPGITLYHSESKSRQTDYSDLWRTARNGMERDLMDARWCNAMLTEVGMNPAWYAGTLPFRMLQEPSIQKVRDHIVATSAFKPWTFTAVSRSLRPDISVQD